MPSRPHLAFPVTLSAGGRLLANEQDSDAEVADCIAAILSWPLGTRRGMPEFGVPTPLFDSGGPNLDEIREAVQGSEPRAVSVRDEVLDESLRNGMARVRLGFDQATE